MIYIIRHGQTQYNLEQRVQGQGIDAPLNETGRNQAKAFHAFYRDIPFQLVIHSSLQRSKQTVMPFSDPSRPFREYSELDEINWGVLEGKTRSPEIKEAYKTMITEWQNGNYDYKVSRGESAQELVDRMKVFVNMLRSFEETPILICSHGRAMRGLMTVMNQEPIEAMEKYNHHNTGLFTFEKNNGRFVPGLVNDTRHLDHLRL